MYGMLPLVASALGFRIPWYVLSIAQLGPRWVAARDGQPQAFARFIAISDSPNADLELDNGAWRYLLVLVVRVVRILRMP